MSSIATASQSTCCRLIEFALCHVVRETGESGSQQVAQKFLVCQRVGGDQLRDTAGVRQQATETERIALYENTGGNPDDGAPAKGRAASGRTRKTARRRSRGLS